LAASRSGKCLPLGDYPVPASKLRLEDSIRYQYLLVDTCQCIFRSHQVRSEKVKMDSEITFNNSSLYVDFILFIYSALENAT
jgi:hypothetical protein